MDKDVVSESVESPMENKELADAIAKYMAEKEKAIRCKKEGIRFKDKSHKFLKVIAKLQGSNLKVKSNA